MHLRRAASLLAGAVLIVAALPGAARAAADTGIFSISPAHETQVTAPPAVLSPLQVTNGTAQRLQVHVFAATLRQELDGRFTVREEADEPAQTRQALDLGADDFVLGPDSARTIGLRWHGAPGDDRDAYLGLVVQGQPVSAADQAIGASYRLLGTRFLRAPGPTHEDGDLRSGRVTDGPDQRLNFTERVRNTGDVFSTPQATEVRITRHGEVVAQARIRTLALLPGATVDLPVTVPKVLAKGAYRAGFTARFGDGSVQRVSERFRVVSPGVLAGPEQAPEPTLTPSGAQPGVPAALPSTQGGGANVPWLWILVGGGGLALVAALVLSLRRGRRLGKRS